MADGQARFTSKFAKTSSILKEVDKRLRRAKDLTPAMRKGVKLSQQSVRQEFLGAFWKSPSGSKVKWKPRRDPKKKHPLLRLSESLLNDWTKGEGKSTPKSFSIGSDREYAEVQRGGSGNIIQTNPIHKNIIPRPHGTHNPELDEKVRLMVLKYITTGAV